jgi:S1-C subfamily serine protease
MQMKPTVRSFVDAGYPVHEIDVTRDPQLARKHNVGPIPCFVMLVDNEEVDRVVGATSGERLQQMFSRAREVERQKASRIRLQSEDPAETGPATAQARNDAAGSAPTAAQPEPYTNLLAATVRLRMQETSGQAYGTGTIIDARKDQALVITCGHLFRKSKGEGPLSVEVFERVAGGVRAAGEVPAQLVAYDLERDLALVGIWPTGAVAVAPVAPKGTAIDRGDRVVSVGCSNGKDPTALESRVTTLDRYESPPNIEATGAPVQGRSGGGLFNDAGQLIGVCFAADYEGNEGLYASLESIQEELAENGLSDIYLRVAGEPARPLPVVRGQEPLETVMPLPDTHPVAPLATSVVAPPARDEASVPQGLNAAEQAAWEEIMARAATAEVICIIRPKEAGGQSEVITLDDVSPEFVRALAERQRKPQQLPPR